MTPRPEDGKCPMSRCNQPCSEEAHDCPYRTDVNADKETLCWCCEDCEYECAQDI